MRAITLVVFLGLLSSTTFAQDRGTCTARCGGKPGGEAANPPPVVACFRKCMGVSGSSDNVKRKTATH
jgi:hypothetical protein